ncbi:putative Ribonuclease H2 subunit B [Hypsibius exemplaris]|uniref:Ribonuclease H2 subunit B n=1 Tax=Hypsibius exemplaris TaxID=2072580 RepID=A0A1W0WTT0_HYPEX|nr:putative Ribonuclease H2 subunit B [Hypsibius exemplaris]
MDNNAATTSELYHKTPEIFTAGLKKKILLVPAAILGHSSSEEHNQVPSTEGSFEISLQKLPHPRTGELSLWAFHLAGGKVYELCQLDEKLRSWFVGNYVLEDGTIKCLVPSDPLFLVLPYLLDAKKRKRFQPLNQILEGADTKSDDTAAGFGTLLAPNVYLKDLDLICSVKGFKDEKFYKLSRAKLTVWLKAKVKLLSEALEREHVNVSTKITAAGYSRKEDTQTKDQYERFAFGMISDQLPLSLQEEMAIALGLGEVKTHSNAANGTEAKKVKGAPVSAAEDYSKALKVLAAVPEKKLTAAQKQLAKVDKTGMKSISSYFTKPADGK